MNILKEIAVKALASDSYVQIFGLCRLDDTRFCALGAMAHALGCEVPVGTHQTNIPLGYLIKLGFNNDDLMTIMNMNDGEFVLNDDSIQVRVNTRTFKEIAQWALKNLRITDVVPDSVEPLATT